MNFGNTLSKSFRSCQKELSSSLATLRRSLSSSMHVTPGIRCGPSGFRVLRRPYGWWLPPRPPWGDWDDGSGGGSREGDNYVYKIPMGRGRNYQYEVHWEGRELVIRGKVTDHRAGATYYHEFTRRHLLPDDVDLSTVQTGINDRGELVITAKYYK